MAKNMFYLLLLCASYLIGQNDIAGQLLRPEIMDLGKYNPTIKKYEKLEPSPVGDLGKYNPTIKKYEKLELSPVGTILGRDEHDYKPHKKAILGGDDHDYKPHKKTTIGGDDHDYKPFKKAILGSDDHDYKPHREAIIGGDDHDYKPHKKTILGGDYHDYKPHKKAVIGGDDHDYKPHKKAIIGGDDHDYKPHKKAIIGGDAHDYKPHKKAILGGDDHDYKPHKKAILGGDDHDYKPHKKAILGGDVHNYKSHKKAILGGDDHDYKPHKKAILGGDDHDYKPHKKAILGGDDHDYKPHKKAILGGDDHDYKPHKKRILGGNTHNYKQHHKKIIGGDDHDYKQHKTHKKQLGGGRSLGTSHWKEKVFRAYFVAFNKTYASAKEYKKRSNIFFHNLKKIKLLQQNERGTAKYGVTKFADWTLFEFRKLLGLRPHLKPAVSEMKPAEIPDTDAPEEFDWRKKGVVTPVKNQGMCGSCWAFSVTGNVEGQWALKHDHLYSLSEQELVDCDSTDHGCNGGLPENAYKAISDLGGLETETGYPYEGRDDKCQLDSKKIKVQVNGSVELPEDEELMKKWLYKNGPISIGINANALQFYIGGVSHPFKFLCSPEDLDHGMLIVGYGVHTTKYLHHVQPYWLVKNSWGENWGEKGYYRVYRGDGTCGVNKLATSGIVP